MRYRYVIATIIVFVASTLRITAQNLSEKYNKEHPVIIVCDWDLPPFEYLNDNGDPAGINIDIIKAVMSELEIPYKFVMKEWSTALRTFERGEADLIFAQKERYDKAPYIASNNILNYNRIRVAMKGDTTRMVSMKSLELEGAVFKPGDYPIKYFIDENGAINSKMEFQTPKVALLGIISGDYKYFIWGEEPLKWKMKELNLEGISLNEVSIPIQELHFIGRDRQLINEIDDQYSRLKQNGEIAKIQDSWLHPERVKDNISVIFMYIGIALLFAVLLALLYFFSLLARKHVQRSTRNSRELNEMMIRALQMGNFDVMQYDIANNRVTNIYGNILPSDGITLEEFTRRIHPDQREEFTTKMKNLMEGRDRQFELIKRWNQGTDEYPKWLNFKGHAILELNHNGQPEYIINAIHDVTQEMEEDKAARELVCKYNTLEKIPQAAMSFYDKNGYLIDLNDGMKKLCGIKEENSLAKNFWNTFSIFEAPLLRDIITPAEREEKSFCQHMVYPEYDIDEYIECDVRPVLNAEGDVANYFITVGNQTEKRNNNKAVVDIDREYNLTLQTIEQRRQQLRYLLFCSGQFIMESNITEEKICIFRSPEKPEFTHNFKRFLQIIIEEDRPRMRHLLYDNTTRTPQRAILHLICEPDGLSGTAYSCTFNPIFNEQGDIIGHEGIISDVTDYFDTQRMLKEQSDLAKDSIRLKSGFMASMTHELRTPLNAIIGFTGVLDSVGEGPERAELVRIIHNSCDMLQRLINDIIEASSITDGSLPIKPEKVDFASAFNDICLTLEQRVEQPAVQFIKDNPYENFYTVLDIERIQQVLTNFVTNAVKYTTQGHIKVGYRYGNRSLYLYCEDTGSGIPKNKQKMIFERFVKLNEYVQGTGMGLAISKSIAESCNGEIGVISEGDGKGSTFWIRIPCERNLS